MDYCIISTICFFFLMIDDSVYIEYPMFTYIQIALNINELNKNVPKLNKT